MSDNQTFKEALTLLCDSILQMNINAESKQTARYVIRMLNSGELRPTASPTSPTQSEAFLSLMRLECRTGLDGLTKWSLQAPEQPEQPILLELPKGFGLQLLVGPTELPVLELVRLNCADPARPEAPVGHAGFLLGRSEH